MADVQHRLVSGLDLHPINAFTVATTTARDALSVVAGDIGKVALVTADNTFFALSAVSPTVWTALGGASGLSTVATSGSYADLTNKPTIPTAVSQLTNDSGFQTAADVSSAITAAGGGSGGTYTLPTASTTVLGGVRVDGTTITAAAGVISATAPTFAAITSKPTTLAGYGITDGQTAAQVATAISGKANTSSLSTVATSGSYADLTNKPTIPTVPTVVSAFTNDSGYQTAAQVASAVAAGGGGGGGDVAVRRIVTSVQNGVTGYIKLHALGTQALLDAVTVTVTGGNTVALTNVGAGLTLTSVAIGYPSNWNGTTSFQMTYPELNGQQDKYTSTAPFLLVYSDANPPVVGLTSAVNFSNTTGIMQVQKTGLAANAGNHIKIIL